MDARVEHGIKNTVDFIWGERVSWRSRAVLIARARVLGDSMMEQGVSPVEWWSGRRSLATRGSFTGYYAFCLTYYQVVLPKLHILAYKHILAFP